jgi:uncharacterized protein YutE (UPF0331/DUF86 family)
VRAHCPPTARELLADRDALDLVSFNLMLAVQTCADIASHIVADEGWAAMPTLAGAFAKLHERGVIESATADALGRAVGLRNVVAHGYTGVDATMVHAAAQGGLGDLDAFARQVGDVGCARRLITRRSVSRDVVIYFEDVIEAAPSGRPPLIHFGVRMTVPLSFVQYT